MVQWFIKWKQKRTIYDIKGLIFIQTTKYIIRRDEALNMNANWFYQAKIDTLRELDRQINEHFNL